MFRNFPSLDSIERRSHEKLRIISYRLDKNRVFRVEKTLKKLTKKLFGRHFVVPLSPDTALMLPPKQEYVDERVVN